MKQEMFKMPDFNAIQRAEKEQQDKEEDEFAADFERRHPELFPKPLESIRECGPEIKEFEEMVASFELEHSLDALNAIIGLTPEEVKTHPVRIPAKIALEPINEKLNILKRETNISPERYGKMYEKYLRLSWAVGILKDDKAEFNKVYHSR